MRQRLTGIRRVEDLAEGMAGAGEPLVGMGRVDRDVELQAPGSSIAGSARLIDGMNRASADRSQ